MRPQLVEPPSKNYTRWPHISHSGAWLLGQCERAYAFRYRDHFDTEPSKAMAKGLFIHRLLAAWWSGKPWQREAQAQVQEWRDAHPRVDEWTGEVGHEPEPEWMADMCWLMERYAAHYVNDRQLYEVAFVEEEFKVKLPGRYGWLVGRLDMGLVDQDGRLWIVDWKSMADWDSLEAYVWAPQFSLYWHIAEQMGMEPWGVLLDALRTYRWKNPRPLQDSFRRRWLDRSPEQVAKAVDEVTASMVRGRDILRGAYPIRNVDRHCGWCPYREPCREELAFPTMSLEIEEDD